MFLAPGISPVESMDGSKAGPTSIMRNAVLRALKNEEGGREKREKDKRNIEIKKGEGTA